MHRFSRLLVVAGLFAACGRPPGPREFDARDVTGNYAITYDDKLTLKLDLGGGVREVTANGYGGIADFGVWNGQPLQLDLTQFCNKPEVQCPSEAFWAKVAIDQPDLSKHGGALQPLVVVNDTVHVLDAGQRAAALGGLVDHNQDDKYLLGLGASGAASGTCVLLGLSLAGGRFTRVGETTQTTMEYRTPQGRACTPSDGGTDAGAASDGGASDAGAPVPCTQVPVQRRIVPPNARVEGIADGKVFAGWAGGCAFGPVVAGAVLTLETGYTGRRTGDFDPPPFTPAPVVLPDGGSYDGGLQDAGP